MAKRIEQFEEVLDALVTPEMLRAGADQASSYDDLSTSEDVAMRVLIAMLFAAPAGFIEELARECGSMVSASGDEPESYKGQDTRP